MSRQHREQKRGGEAEEAGTFEGGRREGGARGGGFYKKRHGGGARGERGAWGVRAPTVHWQLCWGVLASLLLLPDQR
eukprot:2808024-Rhodomonas_salina.2